MTNLRKSIVRIKASSDRIYHSSIPWLADIDMGTIGTGFVVQPAVIMTCAHVAYKKTNVTGHLVGSDVIYAFKVIYAVPEWDIALLAIDESAHDQTAIEKFWSNTVPLEFGPIPLQDTPMQAAGFALSGQHLQRSTGAVIGYQYDISAYSGRPFLTMQFDAQVETGFSGGPVLTSVAIENEVKDLAVGMICHVVPGESSKAQSFAVPVNLLQIVLNNFNDNVPTIIPGFDLEEQALLNSATRELLGLDTNTTGVRVTKVNEYSDYFPQIQAGDVIVSVNNHALSNTGQYLAECGELLHWQLLLNTKRLGDSVEVQLWRDGALVTENIVLRDRHFSGINTQTILYGDAPTYYIYNGFVFTTLEIHTRTVCSNPALAVHWKKFRNKDQLEPVLIKRLLENKNSVGLQIAPDHYIVKQVNGRNIRHMLDLIDAFSAQVGIHKLVTTDGSLFAIKAMSAEDVNLFRNRYEVHSFRSGNLAPSRRSLYFKGMPTKLREYFEEDDKEACIAAQNAPQLELTM